MQREFKYYPSDFFDLKARPLHMDLEFDMQEDKTIVDSRFKLEALEVLKELSLDAKNLVILNAQCDATDIDYDYDETLNKLVIRFKEPIEESKKFTITTKTICRPTKNILEGLYYDETPVGAPPQMITQCQQWGFQRLVPCIDDMRAKCTYKTKITADSRYTHIISNGDLVDKKTVDGKTTVIYDNTKTPMAPYLFFLGAGTYKEFEREFEYPDKDKFRLQLLCPPDSDEKEANQALEILHNAVLWIHIFTGKEASVKKEQRKELYDLCLERERLKKEGQDTDNLKEKIENIASSLTLGYKYTGTVYREIGMQNSNFGGMENVGNTTITTNRLLPFKQSPDGAFEYMIAVKAHEFYHNINGSEVTGLSPFELWLNEAVTCYIEQRYMEYVAGHQYSRLGHVMGIISPDGGTLDFDTGSMTMPIIPEGFNTPDDLISEVTYSKSPEFVRMIQKIMGEDGFNKALQYYYDSFKHKNAGTGEWIAAMNETSDLDFKRMAKVWLRQTGFPTVHVKKEYSQNNLTLSLEQSGFKDEQFWEFPFTVILYDEKGEKYSKKTIWFKQIQEEMVFENVAKPSFISFAPGFEFYGKVDYPYTKDELLNMLKSDEDAVNRYIALTKLAEIEKLRLLDDPDSSFSDEFIDTYHSLLTDEQLCDELGALHLAIPQSVDDRYKKHRYHDLFKIDKRFRRQLATKYKHSLLEQYKKRRDRVFDGPFVQKTLKEIKNRSIKNLTLSILSELDSDEMIEIILDQFKNSTNYSDKYAAFSLYLETSAKDKLQFVREYENIASKNLVEYEVFLARVANTDSDEALKIIWEVEASPNFRLEQSNDQRALFMRFAFNRRLSLQTQDGREYLKNIITRLANVNEYNTVQMLSTFSNINDFPQAYHQPLILMLVQILDSLDKDKNTAVYNTILRLIKGAPKALESYEQKYGKLDARYLG